MKQKIFFFRQAVFDSMPFGYSASTAKLYLYADVVINGNEVIKHRDAGMLSTTLSDEHIAAFKSAWGGGIVVSTPSV